MGIQNVATFELFCEQEAATAGAIECPTCMSFEIDVIEGQAFCNGCEAEGFRGIDGVYEWREER